MNNRYNNIQMLKDNMARLRVSEEVIEIDESLERLMNMQRGLLLWDGVDDPIWGRIQ